MFVTVEKHMHSISTSKTSIIMLILSFFIKLCAALSGELEEIMRIEVRYFTKTGHTKKLAEGIAKELGVVAKSIPEPVDGNVDVLFLGEGLYSFDIDPEMKAFIKTLNPSAIKEVVVFSSGSFGNAYAPMKRELSAQGLKVSSQEFHCKGTLGFMHKNRPNDKDVNNAAVFAKTIAGKLGA